MTPPNQPANLNAGNAQVESGRQSLIAYMLISSSDAFDFLF